MPPKHALGREGDREQETEARETGSRAAPKRRCNASRRRLVETATKCNQLDEVRTDRAHGEDVTVNEESARKLHIEARCRLAAAGSARRLTSALDPPIPPNALHAVAAAYLKPKRFGVAVFGRVVAARARQIFDRAGQRITQRTLRIGVSARIFHPEPGAKGLRGKTLQYLEESIAHWVMSRDVLVFMIPTVGHQGMLHPSNIRLRDYAKHLDGLLLQGGADVSPQSYAEAATRHEWPGDRVRDMYELELLHEFVESGKPVLGVCRGCQLINVAFGGTLYQDIATDVPTAAVHVNEQYDQHRHRIRFPDGSTLVNMFPGRRDAIVNSIHHQAVKTLGRDLNIEAVSAYGRHHRSGALSARAVRDGRAMAPGVSSRGRRLSCSIARRYSIRSCAWRAKRGFNTRWLARRDWIVWLVVCSRRTVAVCNGAPLRFSLAVFPIRFSFDFRIGLPMHAAASVFEVGNASLSR